MEASDKTKRDIWVKGLREYLFSLFIGVLGIKVIPVTPFFIFDDKRREVTILYTLSYGRNNVHRSPKLSYDLLGDSSKWTDVGINLVLGDVEHILREHVREAQGIKPQFNIV